MDLILRPSPLPPIPQKEWRIQIEPAFNSAGHHRATTRTFDINNRMVSEQTGLIQLPGQPLGTLQAGPDTETRRFTYDENGQRKTFQDPRGRITTYEYDLRNRLKKTIEPLNRVTETNYDETGNKTQQWLYYDAFGQEWRFFDERNNQTGLTYQWGPMKKLDTVRTYRAKDGGGSETQLTDFDYDGIGSELGRGERDHKDLEHLLHHRLHLRPEWAGADGRHHREVCYCRYPNGEVSQFTYPNGSTVVKRFTRRAGNCGGGGRGSGAASYVYHSDGKVDYRVFSNGVTTRYEYDARGNDPNSVAQERRGPESGRPRVLAR